MSPREIKDLREALRMTQGQLAARVGVAEETVSRWERGVSSPMFRHAMKLRRLQRAAKAREER